MTKVITAAAAAFGICGLAACATVEEAAVEATSETHRATLTGQQVVTSSGDPDGYATAELSISDELDQICYDLNDVRNLGTVTSVTINRGARGQVGPPVVRVERANEGGRKNCTNKAEWLERSFEYAPGAYYIQVSTTEFPNGAIRGQFD